MINYNNPIIIEDFKQIKQTRENWDLLNHKNIYISGAAGMIASYLVLFFVELNECNGFNIQIYAGIRNEKKAKARFGNVIEKPYFHLIQDDVIMPIQNNIHFDYIIHAASLASPQYYGKMPVETMLPNIVGTYQLLQYAYHNNADRVLFFSSGSVYGSVTNVESIHEESIGLLDFLSLGNIYGESKRCGEALCRAYCQEYGVAAMSARIHHTYGPTLDWQNDKRVFSEFVGNILNHENIILKSDGLNRRAFCYISDTISALLCILLDGQSGESYNVGNNKEYYSISELANILVNLFPEDGLKVVYQKRNDSGYFSSPEKRLIPLSTEKIRKLGWKPIVSVEQGFRRTLEYFRGELK